MLAFHTREEIGYFQKAKRIQIFLIMGMIENIMNKLFIKTGKPNENI
jgi:hypothetical protein